MKSYLVLVGCHFVLATAVIGNVARDIHAESLNPVVQVRDLNADTYVSSTQHRLQRRTRNRGSRSRGRGGGQGQGRGGRRDGNRASSSQSQTSRQGSDPQPSSSSQARRAATHNPTNPGSNARGLNDGDEARVETVVKGPGYMSRYRIHEVDRPDLPEEAVRTREHDIPAGRNLKSNTKGRFIASSTARADLIPGVHDDRNLRDPAVKGNAQGRSAAVTLAIPAGGKGVVYTKKPEGSSIVRPLEGPSMACVSQTTERASDVIAAGAGTRGCEIEVNAKVNNRHPEFDDVRPLPTPRQ